MNDSELLILGRTHTSEQFEKSFWSAREAGFENINVDLMYGIPTQTEQTLYDTIKKVLSLSPEHISVYGLKIEKGTQFYKNRNKLALPDEDTEYTMYKEVCKRLDCAGLKQYEISNYSKPNFECRHNLKYWNTDEYLGTGPSAHSYFDNYRWEIPRGIDDYIGGNYKIEKQFIDDKEKIAEYVMLRMRLCVGVNYLEFKNRFDVDFYDIYGEELKKYVKGGFVIIDEEGCRFTIKGFCVSNTILSDILEFNK
jgi:oxygen-independent coproporphyrinogen-3 oxidase